MTYIASVITTATNGAKTNTVISISNQLVKTFGILCVVSLFSGCGNSDGTPCSRSEDACLVEFAQPEAPPPVEIWWDAPIIDFSENQDRPTISLVGEKTQILAVGEDYVEDGAAAQDLQDGDITSQIMITGQVDSSAIGDYLIRYAVTDSSETVAIEQIRIVRVVSNDDAENLSRRPLGSTISNFGYLEHLPLDYGQTTDQKPPLLIYLHGGGGNLEFANTTDPTLALDAVINNYGVAKLIEDGDWDDTLPFVVLAPQLGAVPSAGYELRMNAFFEYAIRTYDIDPSRIYFTGYSLGGSLSAAFSRDNPDKIAAVASIAPAFPADINPLIDDFCQIERVPFWMFHATNDEVIPFNHTLQVFNDILGNCQPTILPKLSLVLGGEHAIHHAVYNLEALVGGFAQAVYDTRYDPYDMSLYEWLLSHSLDDR